ncbi:DUF6705 family protein [Bacteroides helcogenes]|uniref:DUF6705 domain-containing protein n=1 Tax=Bacteroides helcogenes (strain ATCC 35417 / DSM 20613 / JCM 6297 / CCUG 15421 / P 36-108) TaxID=693979 RepID=E6SUW7_BACT6|nr:DUF6705 family protein [Bacteroides helcogenes]ADV42403.1 hypothetical protein Bache_0375 [Bacteroides helcogenes P 36-108]MDY5237140.1 DUF6705 family protein [Bacteroides helcogenes]
MKRICMILVFVLACIEVFSQANYDAFVGTWVYQKNDTVFRIKLQKGTMEFGTMGDVPGIFGGYYLSVKGVVKEDYIKTMPTTWDAGVSAPSGNIYIDGFSITPNYLGFTFYDQRKQHINGTGIPGGKMRLIAPNKLHWELNEEEGLWAILEGSGEDMTPRGFSVPADVIMTKE